jgi:hypothetical protein
MRQLSFLCIAAVVLLIVPAAYLQTSDTVSPAQDPLLVADRYYRASYARDFKEAYRYLASADRQVKDVNRFVREREPFHGFALEAAKKLAAYIELTTIKKEITSDRAKLTVRMKLPDANRLAPLLLSWDPYQLNSLSPDRRAELLKTIDALHRKGDLGMIEGEETLDMVREADGWKVFLNWAAGVKVVFKTSVPASANVDAILPQSEVLAQTGELFNVTLTLRNRSNRQLFARIGHLVEPKELADYLDLVECGFLLPVALPPGSREEYSTTYLLRGGIPDGTRRLVVTYAFQAEN